MWLVVLREPDGRRTLIGDGGLKGEPTIEGRVDVGYSICASHQCKGFASEMLNALCTWAFEHPEVTYIVGETLPDRPASMRVLEKCGFAFAGITTGHGGEQQVLRYERSR
jgi:RimJ/RimL family protein N-acetyltransferase